MNIYLADDTQSCSTIAQLIELNSACAALHWSINSHELPDKVIDALETIENYIQERIADICDEKIAAFSDEEQSYILSLLKQNQVLRETIGSCIITSGEEANKVLSIIENDMHLKTLKAALASGKNVVIF